MALLSSPFARARALGAVFLGGVQEGLPFAELCVQLADHFPDQDIPSLSLRLLLRSLELQLLRV